jgi:hypothetical protein
MRSELPMIPRRVRSGPARLTGTALPLLLIYIPLTARIRPPHRCRVRISEATSPLTDFGDI